MGLLNKGLIRPIISPWGVPFLFVNNKNGFTHMSIDYWQLNKGLIRPIDAFFTSFRVIQCFQGFI